MGWIAAILSGILAALSYPTRFDSIQFPDLGFLGFFCWIPLFLVIAGVRPRRAFALSFVAGFVQYLISQYWLYRAMNTFGGLSPVSSILVLLFLCTILASYFGLIFIISHWVCRKLGWRPLWIRPIVWTGIEYLRTHLPVEGHPWSQIAYSQGGFLSFIQVADIFGVYAVTFLLVLANELLTLWIQRIRRQVTGSVVIPTAYVLILVGSALSYGYFQLHRSSLRPQGEIPTGVVQGNVPQEEKWERARSQNILNKYKEGTKSLEEKGAQLIIWPEASFPFSVPYDAPEISYDFENQSAELLIGAISYPRIYRGLRLQRPTHNSAVLFDSESRILDYYHKKHLVPLGEYIPYQDVLFFAKKLTAEVGNLQPGETYRPISFRGIPLGVLICYEDIFPEISRIMVGQGAKALINITNDAWYGYSSAAYQHQVFSQFRSVETRRSLIRATNTGVSSLIDPWGRIQWQGELFVYREFLTKLALYDVKSWYVKIGDVLPQVFLGITGIFLLLSFFRSRRPA